MCVWVPVGVSVRECSNVCRVQHRHGETRPRARGSCVLLLLSTAHHQTPAGGLGPRRPPSSTRRCAELQSAVRGISGRPRSRRAWSHLLAPACRFQPRMLTLRWMGFVVVTNKHFVEEEQRQETRGWRAVGGGVDPPRCLVQPACTATPLPDVTFRQSDTIHTAVHVRLAPESAFQEAERGHLVDAPGASRSAANGSTARATCPASCRCARSRQVGSSSRHVTTSCVGAAEGRTRRPTRTRQAGGATAPPHAGPRWAVQYNQEYR